MSMNVLTANRLADGAVVYLGAAGVWSEDLQQAAIATAEFTQDLITQADRAVDACLIIEPWNHDATLPLRLPFFSSYSALRTASSNNQRR